MLYLFMLFINKFTIVAFYFSFRITAVPQKTKVTRKKSGIKYYILRYILRLNI